MKRFLAFFLTGALIFTMSACGDKQSDSPDDFDDFSVVDSTEEPQANASNDSKQETTSSKNPTGNSGTSSSGNDKIENDLTIKDDKTPLESKVNFKGKTFYFGTGTMTDEVTRHVKAFEKKYGCTLEPVYIEFDQFTQQVSARIASGKALDIVGLHGSNFPSAVIANLFAPLQSGFTTADILNESNIDAGGIDYERSKFFAWNNNLYAVTTRTGLDSATSGAIWYNKKMLQAAGCKDPRTLYENGQWDWDAMKQIGKAVTNASEGVYLGKAQLVLFSLTESNGASYINFNDGVAKENLTDPKIYNALKYLQEMCTGSGKMIDIDDYSSDAQSFFEGKIAFYNAAKYNYYSNFNIAEGVVNSNEFGKSLDNLGIVPFPDGPDKKAGDSSSYPWATGYAATIGTSDIRVVLAWAKFISTYKDPVKPKYQLSAEDEALFTKMTNEIKTFKMYGFSDSTNNVNGYVRKFEETIAYGGDISQNISDYRKIIDNCIKVTMSQQ